MKLTSQQPDVRCALPARARLGECPRWDENTGRLYWVDIKSKELHCFNPADGRDVKRVFDEEIGCFALTEDAGFVAGMRSGFTRFSDFDGPVQAITDPEADKPHNRFNDGRCDAAGRFLAGTMNELKSAADGTLYALGTDGGCHTVTSGALTSNGCAFSPDNRTLYYADTPNHVIYAFDYDLETGMASNKQVFHRFPSGKGRPDGAAVDVQGFYWSALYDGGRVVRLNPAGEIVREVAIPARHCTMIAFGGQDLKTAYVTTARANTSDEELQRYPEAGGIFSFRTDVPGLVEHRFGR